MGRVKDNAELIIEVQNSVKKSMYDEKRKIAKNSLEMLKKERPHLTFTPEREEEYIRSFIRNKDFWEN